MKILISLILIFAFSVLSGGCQDSSASSQNLSNSVPPPTPTPQVSEPTIDYNQPQPPPKTTTSDLRSLPRTSTETETYNESLAKTSFTCKNEELYKIWQGLRQEDDDIRGMTPDKYRRWDCSEYIKIAQYVDLNHDGIREVFVKGTGSWGAVSTLPIWVMQKKNDHYEVLLKEQSETYKIKNTITGDYQDLFFSSRRNIISTFLSTYKFKDGNYQRAECQIEFYYDQKKQLLNCADEKKIDELEDKYMGN